MNGHSILFSHFHPYHHHCGIHIVDDNISRAVLFCLLDRYDALTFTLDLKTSAKFLLVVEKDASFQHILGSNFIEAMGPCIVATVCIARVFCLNTILHCQM